jgi:hypothetical protein
MHELKQQLHKEYNIVKHLLFLHVKNNLFVSIDKIMLDLCQKDDCI